MSQARGFVTAAKILEPRAGAQAHVLHEILRVGTPAREP